MLLAHRIAKLDSGVAAWVGAAVAVLATFTCIAIWAAHERARAIEDQGYRTAANLAHVLEQQTVRSIQAVDLTLAGIVDALRMAPSLGAHDPDFEEFMRRKLVTLPYVRNFFVIGTDGFITQDTGHPFTPRIDLADRGYFRVHAENPLIGAHIGPPLHGRSTGTWFISVSRRIDRADGSFGGIAVAAVEVEYFESFYRALHLGKQDTINLLLRDGTLLARAPAADGAPLGRSYADRPMFREHLPRNDVGSFRYLRSSDGRPRIISYRAARDYPIVVAVILSEDAILSAPRHATRAAYAAASAFAVVLGVVTFFYVRYRRRYERSRGQQLRAQHLATLGQMTGGIAHDVNNLLAVIATSARMLRQSAELGERSQAILDSAESAVERGRALTARLLAFAKRQELELRPADANVQLLQIEPLLRQAAGFKVNVVLSLAKDLWRCTLDTAQFDSAILNLLVNARDAMPKGGHVRISTLNVPSDVAVREYALPAFDHVEVMVSDDGPGMPAGVARHAFEPFFTTKGEGGTGLGLSQVYGFVRQLGGDVRIRSAVGSGTSVILLIPRSAEDLPARPPPDQPARIEVPETRTGNAARSAVSRVPSEKETEPVDG